MKETPAQRIQIHAAGVGELSESDLQQRAKELALMDGRNDPSDKDFLAAKEELKNPHPPISAEQGTPVQSWEGPGGSVGQHHHGEAEGSENYAVELIEEGLEEADRDQRLASSKNEEKA